LNQENWLKGAAAATVDSYLIYLYKALRKEGWGRGGEGRGLILRVRSYKANSCRVCSPHTSKDGSNRALLEKDQSTVQDE
jgi:hypothetical protein